MPSPIEEIAIRDLVKHPKLFIIYALLLGAGWIADKLLPDDCHKEIERWQSLYYATAHAKDSIQTTKDILYEDLLNVQRENQEHKEKDKVTDSLLNHLSKKADHLLKKQKHG